MFFYAYCFFFNLIDSLQSFELFWMCMHVHAEEEIRKQLFVIIERHCFCDDGVLFWGGIMHGERTKLHILQRMFSEWRLILHRYLHSLCVSFRGTVQHQFTFMDAILYFIVLRQPRKSWKGNIFIT